MSERRSYRRRHASQSRRSLSISPSPYKQRGEHVDRFGRHEWRRRERSNSQMHSNRKKSPSIGRRKDNRHRYDKSGVDDYGRTTNHRSTSRNRLNYRSGTFKNPSKYPVKPQRDLPYQPRFHRRSTSSSKSNRVNDNRLHLSSTHIANNNNSEMSEEQALMKFIGVGNFDSSKNKNHAASDLSGINKTTKRKYRQYMNRKGGFNRPLSPTY